MATKFLGTDAWKRIKVLNKRPGPRLVAVAYLAENASRRLTLKAGDLLVVRLDMRTVKTGQTSPKDVLAYLEKGVEVHKQGNLHAKVFVFGETAIVGSTNVSVTSEGLLEAAVETTVASVVASAKKFVRSLRGDVVTPQEAERLQKFYQRPKFPRGVPRKKTTESLRGTGHSTIWAVPLVTGTWKDEDYEARKTETPRARKRIRNTRHFTVDDFLWVGGKFARRVRLGERVLQITRVESGRKMVTAPGRVVRKHVYGSSRWRKTLIFLELRKTQRRKALETVCSRLGPLAQSLKRQRGPKQLKDPALLYQLGQLWRSDDSR
jgi:hypothetical protein